MVRGSSNERLKQNLLVDAGALEYGLVCCGNKEPIGVPYVTQQVVEVPEPRVLPGLYDEFEHSRKSHDVDSATTAKWGKGVCDALALLAAPIGGRRRRHRREGYLFVATERPFTSLRIAPGDRLRVSSICLAPPRTRCPRPAPAVPRMT